MMWFLFCCSDNIVRIKFVSVYRFRLTKCRFFSNPNQLRGVRQPSFVIIIITRYLSFTIRPRGTKTWRTVIAFRRPSCRSPRCDTRSNGVRRRTDSTTTPRSACVLRAGWSVPTSHTHTPELYIYYIVCVCVKWVLTRCSSPKTIPSMMGFFFSFIPLNAAALCLNKIFFCSRRRHRRIIIKIIRL